LHETGHFYLEVVGELATAEAAPADLKEDFQTILDWMGVKSREEIGTDQHEQFARGFEAYLMEGKAPTSALRQAFSKFRAWLVSIYKSAANLRVELTPEVRGVFDRMLATQEEIAAAQDQTAPLFQDPAAFGLSEQDAAKYASAIEDSKIAAEEELSGKLFNEYMREKKTWWKEERSQVRAEVAAEINAQPVYVARSVLQSGKYPDGTEVPPNLQGLKMSKQDLVAMYDEAFLKKLPKPYMYSVEGGMHPDLIGEMFGFSSGDEMIQSMMAVKDPKAVIEARTDALMKARHDIRAELLESLADEIAEGADPGDELLKPKRSRGTQPHG
jgi:hypothetical protein